MEIALKVYAVTALSSAMERCSSLANKQKLCPYKSTLDGFWRWTQTFFSQVAPFHNLFGIAGLSLLDREEQTKAVHPVFCIPEDVVQE